MIKNGVACVMMMMMMMLYGRKKLTRSTLVAESRRDMVRIFENFSQLTVVNYF